MFCILPRILSCSISLVYGYFYFALVKFGSSGLVVKGGDSQAEGCEFESRCQILDGHVFTLIVCLKRPKIKRPRVPIEKR